MLSRSYKNSLTAAIVLHLAIAIVLFVDPSSNKPAVLELTNTPELTQSEAAQMEKPVEPIKAVSVDASEVMKTMDRIKEQRAQQQRAEATRQRNLERQAEMARQARIKEQQQLQKLKQEAETVAIARKKQMEEEKKRLERLAQQKIEDEKRLAEIKKQQQLEASKLAELKKKQDLAQKAAAADAEAKRLAEIKHQQDAKAKADAEQKRQQLAKQAAASAEKTARIAGEVDRYKALIITAISRQWILPENTQNNLFSQFRIRLAPDGSVLEVTLIRSSGDSVLDRSAQSAIYKASPLPVPTDPEAFNVFRDISLTVKPENARG